MTKKLLFVMTILLAVAFVAAAADVTGKWTYEQAGRGGKGGPTTITLDLKASGGTLTGSMTRPGRGGGDPMVTQISDGKVDGNTVTFTTKREGQNGTVVTTYKGTLNGDSLDLEITAPGRGGDPMTTKVSAKRATT